MTDDRLMIGKEGIDPLTTGPNAAQELFNRYSKVTHGFPNDAAVAAAANIILNSLRQTHKKRKDADDAVIGLLERVRSTLNDHYDHLGDRRSIFPFHQSLTQSEVIKFAKPRR